MPASFSTNVVVTLVDEATEEASTPADLEDVLIDALAHGGYSDETRLGADDRCFRHCDDDGRCTELHFLFPGNP